MAYDVNETYLEAQVISASPLELVRILYGAALDAVREARRHLAEGAVRDRSLRITKAVAIMVELSGSLDLENGGELAGRLALLYDYIERRLLDANVQQADEPLAEVLGLLTTLRDAWEAIPEADAAGDPAPVSAALREADYGAFSEPAGTFVSQSWSA